MRKLVTSVLVVPTLAVSLLGLAGCGGSTPAASAPSTSPSATSASASATASASSSDGALLADLPAVDGYAYTDLPAELSPVLTAMKSGATLQSVTAKGVLHGSGTDVVAALFVAHYLPTLATALDKTAPATVLAGAVSGAKAFTGGDTGSKVTTTMMSGVPVAIIGGKDLALAVVYRKGGRLVEVFGPSAAAVTGFAKAYLAA